MAKRGWIIGGSLVGVGALTLVAVLAWRTAEVLGVVVDGGVDLGVKLDEASPTASPMRHAGPIVTTPSGKDDKEGDKLGRAVREAGTSSDILKMAPSRLAVRHDARNAWRQNLSEEELAAVRERVKEKQDGLSPEARADREARRQARREAIGLSTDPDQVDPDALPEEQLPPEPQ